MKAVLFDLDGTLLPMQTQAFLDAYLPGISACCPRYLDPKTAHHAIMAATFAMIENQDANKTCQETFRDCFIQTTGLSWQEVESDFLRYYQEDFGKLGKLFPADVRAAKIVKRVRQKGWKAILATNPLFPTIAVHQRLAWAGIDKDWFDHISTYENASFCKPNPRYYQALMDKLGLTAADCVMVGNDVEEDILPTVHLGIKAFWLTHSAIVRTKAPKMQAKGGFDELLSWIEALA